jgi:23S rRNA pseudouridine1911/1915/1917 synthase
MASDPRDGTFRVPPNARPDRLDRVLKSLRPDLSWGAVRELIARGKVSAGGVVLGDPAARVGEGAELTIRMAASAPRVAAVAPFEAGRVVHQDPHVVVVDKPAGLNTVPWGEETDALDVRLRALLGRAVRVVHRLDRDTTGLLMFARTAEAEGRLQHQLRKHTVHRRYLALVHGDAKAMTLRSFLDDDRGDGLRGSVPQGRGGKEAITHVEVVEHLRGATLVACRLETGRTHQIRVQLAEAGHMLLGERGYVRDHQGPVLQAPRILLHAAELGFAHPDTGVPLRFEAATPVDMAEVVEALRTGTT